MQDEEDDEEHKEAITTLENLEESVAVKDDS